MSGTESGTGDEVVLDVFGTITSQELNQLKKPSSSSSSSKGIIESSAAPQQNVNVDLCESSITVLASPEISQSSDTFTRRKPLPGVPSPDRIHSFNDHGVTSSKSGSRSVSIRSNRSHSSDPAHKEDEEDEMVYAKVKMWKLKYEKTYIEWILSLCVLCVLVSSLIVNKLENVVIWGIELWRWCVLAIVMLRGVMATSWSMYFLLCVFTVRSSSRRRNLYYFFLGMKKSVEVFMWLGLVLLTWLLLFRHGGAGSGTEEGRSKASLEVIRYVTWTLVSLLTGAFLWVLKTMLFRILAFRFQVAAFFDRIQESSFHQLIIYLLSALPLMEMVTEMYGGSPAWSGRETYKAGKERNVIDMEMLLKLKKDKVSVETMEALVNVVCGSGLSTAVNSLDETEEEVSDKVISSEMEATAAAYRIFRNVAKPGCRYIDEFDLLRFLTKEEADLVLPLFEGANSGRIDRKSLTDWVVKVYNVRKGLIHSLTDTKKSIKQLDTLVIGIVIIITIIAWLLMVEIATTKVLLFLSSQLLLAAFIFGDTCKRIFESILFLFVLHPFDVGDRCVVDDVSLMVEEMNILTTVFLKLNNEIVYYPNSVLSTKPIINLSRSNLGDIVQFSIALTPQEEIDKLKAKIKMYLEESPQYWSRNHNVVVTEIDNGNFKVALYFSFVMSFQEFGEKTKRRSELVIGLMEIFKELNIKYSLMSQEVALVPTKYEATA